jgi:hypothetical protein
MSRIALVIMLTAAAVLSGCDAVSDYRSQLSKLDTQVTALNQRVTTLEAAAALPPPETYVMWESEILMANVLGGKPPTAEGAYPSKSACLRAAEAWTATDGGAEVSSDPVVFQSKKWKVMLRCLPKGVEPFSKG